MWTIVNGDAIPMRRGDFLPQFSWNWHGHLNPTDGPMAWLDGLDIPFQYATESQFFEFGPDTFTDAERQTPAESRSELLWRHGGLTPLGFLGATQGSPLFAYRWANTDQALSDQLALGKAGHDVLVEPGHAAVRYTNPSNAADVLATIRTEFHRLATGAEIAPNRQVGSRCYQVFDGSGSVTVGDETWAVTRGDVFVVPSWVPFSARSSSGSDDSDSGALDLFVFSDAPIFEKLNLYRTDPEGK